MLTPERTATSLTPRIRGAIRGRAPVARAFFEAQAEALAGAAATVAERLASGGRIYAFGRGAYATDAQHVAVEFVHPVLVGKRALPASDLSLSFEAALPALVRAGDVVVGFGPPAGDPAVGAALAEARELGAFTLAFPGAGAGYAMEAPGSDEHVHQEIVEICGHLLYESVHVFLEHRPSSEDAGAASFLYPFLGGAARAPAEIARDVARSILQKTVEAEALRERVASEESGAIEDAAHMLAGELARGGRLLVFGNGGSATDATDFALDCVAPPQGLTPFGALSLAVEPATITAIANDVGRENVFLRQLIAHVRPHDVAVALSTSGGSSNVIAALEEARKRGNRTLALLGYDGGEIVRRGLCDVAIVVRSDYVPRIQEAQATIYHTLRHAIEWARDGA